MRICVRVRFWALVEMLRLCNHKYTWAGTVDTCIFIPCFDTHVLPFGLVQSQLDAMKLNRLHAATTAPSPNHIRAREEKVEVRTHQRAHRVSSADNTHPKSAIQENRITTIPEITEVFERRLCLHDRKTLALVSICCIFAVLWLLKWFPKV